MSERGKKSYLGALGIALIAGTAGHLAGDFMQYLSGGSDWLPNGHESFTFWFAAVMFSYFPLAGERR